MSWPYIGPGNFVACKCFNFFLWSVIIVLRSSFRLPILATEAMVRLLSMPYDALTLARSWLMSLYLGLRGWWNLEILLFLCWLLLFFFVRILADLRIGGAFLFSILFALFPLFFFVCGASFMFVLLMFGDYHVFVLCGCCFVSVFVPCSIFVLFRISLRAVSVYVIFGRVSVWVSLRCLFWLRWLYRALFVMVVVVWLMYNWLCKYL